MKILFIGGTGLISSACSELAIERGHELFLSNRSVSTKYPAPKHSTILQADIHPDSAHLSTLLAGHRFDAVVDLLHLPPKTSLVIFPSSAIRQINLFSSLQPVPIKSHCRIISSPKRLRWKIHFGNIPGTRSPAKNC